MTLRILAIDDSRTMREMLKSCLSGAGFEVHTADDGLHGIERMGEVDPDLVITDINMPRLDGFGVIEAIRGGQQRPRRPILVLTTESAPEMKDRARKAGATGWIVKPFDDDRLITAIRRIASV